MLGSFMPRSTGSDLRPPRRYLQLVTAALVTIEDPVNMTAPAVLDSHWLALGATVARFDCQATR